MILLVIIFFLEIAFSFLPNLSGFITSLISRLVIKIADEELNIRSEIKDLKEQQSSISATENFAQYARLQRKIDKLVNTVKERDKERRKFIVYLRMKVTAAIYIVHVIVMLVLMVILRSEPLLMLEESWVSPFARIVAFPTGIPGAVGLGCWVLVSNAVIHRAKVLVESFM
ncbi:tail-anchored protein insertion receptor WRB [Biomphalaria pfeifferi]|uniref:Guided entry of tail-anchored proteins factor 1 n=1 Tax=Biomphalaria pfeifferi TaxID=112525 RepID=A0AAD8BEY6_BIOPF|nr:tail-anchored protein insertion receptor WRB [Biomphalaria pfeifferi]